MKLSYNISLFRILIAVASTSLVVFLTFASAGRDMGFPVGPVVPTGLVIAVALAMLCFLFPPLTRGAVGPVVPPVKMLLLSLVVASALVLLEVSIISLLSLAL